MLALAVPYAEPATAKTRDDTAPSRGGCSGAIRAIRVMKFKSVLNDIDARRMPQERTETAR